MPKAYPKSWCLLLLLSIWSLTGYAQQNNSKAQQTANSIEINLQKSLSSFSIAQNKIQGSAYGGEFIYRYNVNRSPKKWSSDLKIKSIDLIFNYKRMEGITRIGAPKSGEFGDSFGFLGGFTFLLLDMDKVNLEFSPGLGLIYAGESWFSNQNPVVGSKLNFGLKAGLKVNVPVNSRTTLAAIIDILHYSNGGVRVPNNGMNIASVGLGVATNIGQIMR